MKVQGCNFAGLLALSSITILLPGTVIASSSSAPSTCNSDAISNGTCDEANNNNDCDFDGGDCCECTCVNAEYDCSASEFVCIDPNAQCVNDDDDSTNTDDDSTTNDDDSTTTDGDFTTTDDKSTTTDDESTTTDDDFTSPAQNSTSSDESITSFADDFTSSIDDASSPSSNTTSSADNVTSSAGGGTSSGCNASWISDGTCDGVNNNEDCGYDGGDCCECTCVNAEHDCPAGEFSCIDPSAPCVNSDGNSTTNSDADSTTTTDDDSTNDDYTSTIGCYPGGISDGFCDTENNNEECEYDGGDCCVCTCIAADDNCPSSLFNCLDPSAGCVNDDDDSTTTWCETTWIGDGECDQDNNNENCGDYDGGDCCECTCVSAKFNCPADAFSCIDPNAPCVNDDDDSTTTTPVCQVDWVGDGFCDEFNNNEECGGYDGGDCCQCTCVSAEYDCPPDFFSCIDPDATCVNDDDDGISCITGWIGDGICDHDENNNEACEYDGGDCCECTCIPTEYRCPADTFLCIDPIAICVDDDDGTTTLPAAASGAGKLYRSIGGKDAYQEPTDGSDASDGSDGFGTPDESDESDESSSGATSPSLAFLVAVGLVVEVFYAVDIAW